MDYEKGIAGDPVEILIAEDSPVQAEQLRGLLREAGYGVTVSANGREALEAMEHKRPAVIISDIVMPEMDGYELCKAVKNDPQKKDIPVILVTSLSAPQDVIKGLECGADNFIRKPYDGKYLISRVQYIVANQILRRSERLELGFEIFLGGQKYFIAAPRQQILDLLISTYEEAIRLHEDLKARQMEIGQMYEKLEEEVEGSLKKQVQDLQQSNKDLEDFAYIVSHDLQEPLRKVTSFADRLRAGYAAALTGKGEELLGRMQWAVMRMQQLIDDLLHYSRVTKGEKSFQTVDLGKVAHEVLSILESRIAESGGQVEIRNLPEIPADESQMQELLQNLIGNAVKFAKKGVPPRVVVEGKVSRDGALTITVEDNGIGFDERCLEEIFQPFRRLNPPGEFEGSGMGLAICKKIVQRHGGAITAKSIPGEGSTFILSFPVGGQKKGIENKTS